MDKKLEVVLDYAKVVNFAMQQNRRPVINSLQIINDSQELLENVMVEISSDPPCSSPWSKTVSLLEAGRGVKLPVEDFALAPAFCMAVTERIAGMLRLQILAGGETLLAAEYPIDVLPYNQWGGGSMAPELLAAFVTPNYPLVSNILGRAAELLGKWTGDSSLCGYQRQSENDVRLQMAAVFAALQELEIVYVVPPASFEDGGQKIRLADDMMSQKLGTCLDFSLLYASCLEALGLHPFIVFITGHAFAGAWLVEQSFPSPCQDDFSLLSKRFTDSVGEVSLVECTLLAAGKHSDFKMAETAARDHFLYPDNFNYFIDITAARELRIRPLPQRKYDEDGRPIGFEEQVTGPTTAADEMGPAALDIVKIGAATPAKELEKTAVWRNKLLDLSNRNSLLSFKPTGSSLQLVCDNLSQLEDALAGKEEFKLIEFFPELKKEALADSFLRLTDESQLGSLLQTEFTNRRLRTFYTEAETKTRITGLYRSAKSSLEENGANTLYLALGFLKWYDTKLSEKARYAPLVLLPLEITRKSARQGYVIKARDEDTLFNITLLEKLRLEFNINISGLDPLPLDDSGVDLTKIFAIVRHAVMDQKKWDVLEVACIGQFSFSQFIMWNDLQNRLDELQRHPIIQSLIAGHLVAEPPALVAAEALDETIQPADVAVPVSADSSQLAAICSAGQGASFVLHGPPGTGKSQTITNIIANALFKGQTVLFIAEKMAALSVVQKRLEKIGLGPFCLELHSNKANKSYVLKQLQTALEYGARKNPEDYAREAEVLQEQRGQFNGWLEKLHRQRLSGWSLYQVIGIYEAHPELMGTMPLPMSLVEKADDQALQTFATTLQGLATAAKDNGQLAVHPLKEWRAPRFQEQTKEAVSRLLKEISGQIQEVSGLVTALKQPFQYINLETERAFSALQIVLEKLPATARLPRQLLWQETAVVFETVNELVEHGQRLKEVQQQLEAQFESEVYELEAVELRTLWKEGETSWLIPKYIKQNKVVKAVRAWAREPKSITRDNVELALHCIITAQKEKKFLAAHQGEMAELLGEFWRGEKSDWDLIKVQNQTAWDLSGQLFVLFGEPDSRNSVCDQLVDLAGFAARYGQLLAKLLSGYQALVSRWRQLAELVVMPAELAYGRDWLEVLAEKVSRWQGYLPRWRYWCLYQEYRQKAEALGLEVAALALENGAVSRENLVEAFRVNAAYNLAIKYIDEDSDIGKMTAAMMAEELAKYGKSIEKFTALTRKELIARLAAKIPNSNFTCDSGEVGLLKKAISNRCRGKSIRQLFDSIPNLLPRLAPCMLMSPISVAQFIDPKFPKFDLVIFDEASQLPTCEAVGAIARGRSLVVVGDPKQLPPTSFFKKEYTDEDNLDKADLESILDDCLAISMPEMHLQWHYRSKDESLIAFSNYRFYEQKLFTFPSPTSLAGHVKFIPVKGVYDKCKSRQNVAEAEKIVEEICRRLQDPVLRKKSIGVVTFSVVQQHLIEDLLEKRLAEVPQLELFAQEAEEPLFVKNLESVQGDERDVIMFSIGYGPDASGHVSMNFGPINNAGGERRLNVAVSRARQDMLVFSTMQPEQIDLNRTASRGVQELKAFLQFAKNGPAALNSADNGLQEPAAADNFRQSVARALTGVGLQVVENVGCSEFKIDLAVVNPEKPDQYILGILCDGENYRHGATAKDRNILQRQVLEGLGWNILRLMAVEWFISRDDRREIIRRIEELVARLVEEQKAPAPVAAAAVPPAEDELAPEEVPETCDQPESGVAESDNNLSAYVLAELPPPPVNGDVYDPANTSLLQQQVQSLVAAEGPVAESVLLARLGELWGQKKTSRFFERIINSCDLPQVVLRNEGGRAFYWPADRVEELVPFRMPVPALKRNMADISIWESGWLIKKIVDEQLSINTEDVMRMVLNAAGFVKCSAQFRVVLEEAINNLVAHNYVQQQDTRLQIVTPNS